MSENKSSAKKKPSKKGSGYTERDLKTMCKHFEIIYLTAPLPAEYEGGLVKLQDLWLMVINQSLSTEQKFYTATTLIDQYRARMRKPGE